MLKNQYLPVDEIFWYVEITFLLLFQDFRLFLETTYLAEYLHLTKERRSIMGKCFFRLPVIKLEVELFRSMRPSVEVYKLRSVFPYIILHIRNSGKMLLNDGAEFCDDKSNFCENMEHIYVRLIR